MTKKLLITAIVLMMILLGIIGYKLVSDISNDGEAPSSASSTEVISSSEVSSSVVEKEGSEAIGSEKPEPVDPEQDDRFFNTDSLLIVANKKHPLPEGYEPADLAWPVVDYLGNRPPMRLEAAEALESMFAAAQQDGVHLILQSGYRSASYQAELYTYYSGLYGSETADTISSRPGYSDHQTGLACDLASSTNPDANLRKDYINTVEGQWLYAHAHEYGFIMRYPVDKDEMTGYAYEPWHYRYIGVEEATAMYNTDPDLSFEEYYGVAGGGYAD